MGIVSEFDFDIFISYAHVDNLSIAEEDKGWITDFHSTLSVKLWKEFGKKPSIWRDTRDLDGRMADPTIAPAIHSSAVFVVVMSTAYMQSFYCQKEVAEFYAYQHPVFKPVVRGHSRSIVVVYGDVASSEWRAELRDVPTVLFFETDEATGVRTLYQKPKRADPDRYWERLDLTIRHLASVLREMQRGPTTGTEVVSAAGLPQQLPVYLAEATDDLQTERSEVFKVLDRGSKRAGFSIEPARSIIESVSVQQACRDGLARANASVHLINATPGRVWGDAGKPLAQLELELALERASKPRPLVWIAPDLKLEAVKDPGYRSFLQQLKSGQMEVRTSDVRTPEVFDMPFDRFLGQIESRLFPPVKAVWQEVRQKQPNGVLVYISSKNADSGPLDKLIECLRSRKCAVAHLDHGSGADVQQRHETNLRFCDGLVVLYSRGKLSWAENIAYEARTLAHERHRPKKLGVLNEDLPPAPEFGLIDDDLVVPVRLDDGVQCGDLDKFLGAIGMDGNV